MSRWSRENSLKQTHALENLARAVQDLRLPSLDDPPWPGMCIPKPPSKCTHVLLSDGWHQIKQGDNGYSQIMGSHGLFCFTRVDGIVFEGPTSSMLAIKVEHPGATA